jgi:hypothetical protein
MWLPAVQTTWPRSGTNSICRILSDFYLPQERIVVEAKMTRASLGQKEVTDQLIIDAVRYGHMEGVETLICLVYDPERRCANPRAIENDVENSGSRLRIRAVVCPQGL